MRRGELVSPELLAVEIAGNTPDRQVDKKETKRTAGGSGAGDTTLGGEETTEEQQTKTPCNRLNPKSKTRRCGPWPFLPRYRIIFPCIIFIHFDFVIPFRLRLTFKNDRS